jgi:hypothetical protein
MHFSALVLLALGLVATPHAGADDCNPKVRVCPKVVTAPPPTPRPPINEARSALGAIALKNSNDPYARGGFQASYRKERENTPSGEDAQGEVLNVSIGGVSAPAPDGTIPIHIVGGFRWNRYFFGRRGQGFNGGFRLAETDPLAIRGTLLPHAGFIVAVGRDDFRGSYQVNLHAADLLVAQGQVALPSGEMSGASSVEIGIKQNLGTEAVTLRASGELGMSWKNKGMVSSGKASLDFKIGKPVGERVTLGLEAITNRYEPSKSQENAGVAPLTTITGIFRGGATW